MIRYGCFSADWAGFAGQEGLNDVGTLADNRSADGFLLAEEVIYPSSRIVTPARNAIS